MARWTFAPAGALLFVSAACATPPAGEKEIAERPVSQGGLEVIYEAYRHMRERYVQSVPIAKIAGNSLKGLSALDKSIKATVTRSRILLAYNGRTVRSITRPRGGRTYNWARRTHEIVLAAEKASPKVRKAGSEKIYQVMFRSATRGLDRYSRYATAAEARNRRAIQEGYTGIGISVRSEKGMTIVVMVMPGTPAERAGLKAEDAIVGIEGQNIVGWELSDVVRKLRGPRGSAVRVTLERGAKAKKRLKVKVRRGRINPHTIVYKRMGRIAHIRILRFSGNTTTDLVKAVNRARAEIGSRLAGIILDMRNNPGGYLDQANSVSDIFMNSGRIISTRGRHPRSRRTYWARPGDTSGRAPIVVLVNGNSASSAEIVASALQDNGRAIIVGSNSFGKGTVQSVAPLPNGGEIIITWSRFHAPSGYALERLGLLPNVCTSRRTPNAQAAIQRLSRGKTLTRYVFRTWRQRIRPVKWANKLRRTCPAKRGAPAAGRDIDLEVAKRILLRPQLYHAARRLGQAQSAKLR
jgi:carboxyl-terminal processing protease